MNPIYFRQLSAENKRIVESVEMAICREIRIDESETEYHSCRFEDLDAWISVPQRDVLPDASAFHELSHLHRFLVERVPRYKPNDESDAWLTLIEPVHALDSALEHLVIVPRELERYPERRQHWRSATGSCFGPQCVRSVDLVLALALIRAADLGNDLDAEVSSLLISRFPTTGGELSAQRILDGIGDKITLLAGPLAELGVPADEIYAAYYHCGLGWSSNPPVDQC